MQYKGIAMPGFPAAIGLDIYHVPRARKYGWRSAAALQEMTTDISFALDNFDREAQRASFQSAVRENDRRILESGQPEELEEVDSIRGGKAHVFWSVKIPLRDAEDRIYALCGISINITEHHDNRERIRVLSNYDTLTGLPNRELPTPPCPGPSGPGATRSASLRRRCGRGPMKPR